MVLECRARKTESGDNTQPVVDSCVGMLKIRWLAGVGVAEASRKLCGNGFRSMEEAYRWERNSKTVEVSIHD